MSESHPHPCCPVCGVRRDNFERKRKGGSSSSSSKRRWSLLATYRHLFDEEQLDASPCNDHICPRCYLTAHRGQPPRPRPRRRQQPPPLPTPSLDTLVAAAAAEDHSHMDVDCEPPHSSTASPSPLLQPPPSTHDSSCICSECAEHDSAHVQPQGLDECERVLPAVNGGVSTLATAQPSPPTLLPPTPIRLSVSSFTSHPAVVNALYPTVSPHPGLAVWSLHESDFPLTTAEPHHKPLYFDAITHIKAAAEHMPAIPFNLPDRGSSGDCKDEQPQPTDPRVLTDVLALVKEGRDNTADEKPEMALYQKDIPFSAWQPTEQQPMAPQPQQQQQQQQQPQEQPQQQQPEQTPPPIRSPFNPHLFVHEPTNLSCLMDDHDFPGFTTPSWYVKKPGSFFCMHVEQLFAPFYNLCYDGSTTWWVVQRDTRGKLNDYMVRRARRLYGVPEDVKLSEEEAEAVHGLLFTKQVMFHPDDLIRAGVVLSEVKQEAGMVVVGDGDVVHLGMTTVASSEQRQSQASRSVNEAINFLPIQWLTTGLPELVAWMRWLQRSWLPMQRRGAMAHESRKKLRAAIQDERTNRLVAQHCAPHWSWGFLRRLRALFEHKPTAGTLHHDTWTAITQLLDERAREAAVANIDAVLEVMKDKVVEAWLLKHSLLPDETMPRKRYVSPNSQQSTQT